MSTVFVTKYALSEGIKECEVLRDDRETDGFVRVAWPGGLNGGMLIYSSDAHDSMEDALVAADAARIKKVASLKKQIAKLEAKRFE